MDLVWGVRKEEGSGPSWKFCSSIWMNGDAIYGDRKGGVGLGQRPRWLN